MVSIIVPSFNQSSYIRECLDSIKSQTYADWECVIYDDASTDASIRIIEETTKGDSRFRIYRAEKNRGLALTRNAAINIALGAYILPLDSDDFISSNFILRAVKVLDEDSNIRLVVPSVQMFGALTSRTEFKTVTDDDILIRLPLPHCCMFRKADFLKTKGYDPDFIYSYEDVDFWISFWFTNALTPRNVACLNDICFYYRRRADSKSLDMLGDKEKQSFTRKLILKKYPELYEKYGF